MLSNGHCRVQILGPIKTTSIFCSALSTIYGVQDGLTEGHLQMQNGCFYRTQVYLGSDLWVQVSLSTRGFADLTDVTLADEDTNSILTDSANKAIQGNVSYATWWPTLEPIQVVT